MAQVDDQKNPKPANPRKAERKAGGKGGRRGQYLTQSLPPIGHAPGDRSGNQTYDGAQPQENPDLLG